MNASMIKPKKMTVAEVKKKFGIDIVPNVVSTLHKEKMGALIVSASGEAIMLEYLRAAMPAKSGLIVGVITDPPTLPKPLTGRAAHEAIANARAEARMFADRPTPETRHRLIDALDKIAATLT